MFLKLSAPAVSGRRLDATVVAAAPEAIADPTAFARVEALARFAGLSRSRFAARLSDALGEAPMRWLRRERMRYAERALASGERTVAEVAGELGYASETTFRRCYRRVLDKPARATPDDLR